MPINLKIEAQRLKAVAAVRLQLRQNPFILRF
jgi:hypothetical protein